MAKDIETPEEAERIVREGTPESRRKIRLLELLASPEYRDKLYKMRADKQLKDRSLKNKAKSRLPSSAEEANVPRSSIGGAH